MADLQDYNTKGTKIVLVIWLALVCFLLGMAFNNIRDQPADDWAQTMLKNGERLSNRVTEEQISVSGGHVTIVGNYTWAGFRDSNSMFPTLDNGSNAIQLPVTDDTVLKVSDIVSYVAHPNDQSFYHHRIVAIGEDEEGTYYTLKGDNNPSPDPGKVRRDQIKKVTVAIIY